MADKPKAPKTSTRLMLAALGIFVLTWLSTFLILLMPGIHGHIDLIEFLLYFCGPLPILPAALFLIGFGMLLFGR